MRDRHPHKVGEIHLPVWKEDLPAEVWGTHRARITMACSRLVMQQWGEAYTSVLLRSNIRLRLFGNYVDDIRQGTNNIPKGHRYIKLGDVIEFRQELKEQDDLENLSDLK